MDKYKGEDPCGLLRGIKGIYNGNQRKHARYTAWDQWDNYYGCGKLDYEVYILTDLSKPGIYRFGPLKIYHEPFYVGSGKIKRHLLPPKVINFNIIRTDDSRVGIGGSYEKIILTKE